MRLLEGVHFYVESESRNTSEMGISVSEMATCKIPSPWFKPGNQNSPICGNDEGRKLAYSNPQIMSVLVQADQGEMSALVYGTSPGLSKNTCQSGGILRGKILNMIHKEVERLTLCLRDVTGC